MHMQSNGHPAARFVIHWILDTTVKVTELVISNVKWLWLNHTLSFLLIVLCCFPQCHHDIFWKISGLSSAPADTFAFGMVHIPKIIECPRLPHLTGNMSGEDHFLLKLSNTWIQISDFYSLSLIFSNTLPHLVIHVPGYVQVPLTANHSLIEPTQHLQCVAEVTAGFGLSDQVANCPEQDTSRC